MNRTFINHNFDWNKIKQTSNYISIYHGDNDPYVPIEQPQNVGEKLNISLNIIRNGGHLNEEAGYTEFHELYNDIIKRVDL